METASSVEPGELFLEIELSFFGGRWIKFLGGKSCQEAAFESEKQRPTRTGFGWGQGGGSQRSCSHPILHCLLPVFLGYLALPSAAHELLLGKTQDDRVVPSPHTPWPDMSANSSGR